MTRKTRAGRGGSPASSSPPPASGSTATAAVAATAAAVPIDLRDRIAASYLAMALAHELKQPLNLLNLNVELLSKRLGKTAETKEIGSPLAAMGTVVERVTDTLEAFTARVSPAPVESDLVDVSQAIGAAVERAGIAAQKAGVRLAVEHDSRRFPRIPANVEHLTIALQELLENAVFASPKGGVVTLRTRTEDDEVFIEVQDRGGGMSAEVLRHAVEIGFSTREAGGIGMTVAKFIAYHHGGGFHVASTVGEGTTVSIALPVHPD